MAEAGRERLAMHRRALAFVGAVVRYYAAVATRALSDTWRFAHRQGLAVGAAVAVLNILLGSDGQRQVHVGPLIAAALEAVGAVMLLALLVNAVLAPVRIDQDRRAEVEGVKSEYAEHRRALERARPEPPMPQGYSMIDHLNRMAEKQAEHSMEEAHRKRQPAARLDALLRRGHELREWLRNHEHDPVECRDAYVEWELATGDELREASPADLDAFVDAGGENSLAKLNARMKVLSDARRHAAH